jgi:hypothetical protein
VWAQGLHGTADLTGLDTLTTGLQDTPAGAAALALRHRTDHPQQRDHPDLVLALTMRGAPHLHRRGDLPTLRAALHPKDNDMLCAYLGGYGDTLTASDADGPALLATVADELRAAFPGETASKGELSAAVSPRVPQAARPWCEGCGAAHVADGLFRLATLYAGIELVQGEGRKLMFRLDKHKPPTAKNSEQATTTLLKTAIRLAGPMTLSDLATWLATRSVTASPNWLKPAWTTLTDHLVEVTIDGKNLHAAREAVDALGQAPDPPAAQLLPPRDPYLLGHRHFLVPDRALAKEIWRPVGSPGALVVAGEAAGVWRARKNGKTLQLTITPHTKLTAKQREAVTTQADLVAETRNHEGKVIVTID